MAIEYSKVGWDVAPYKYANPDNMNKMDTGIKAAVDGVNALEYVPSALEEIKVLGWSTPKAMSVRNYMDSSRQLHIKVGRSAIDSFSWSRNPNNGTLYALISGAKVGGASYISNFSYTYYVDGSSYMQIKGTSYTSVSDFLSAEGSKFIYYELSTEIIVPIDGNEVATSVEELKVLGYTIPKEMSVRNYVDSGRNIHVRVGRVDLGQLGWTYDSGRFFASLTLASQKNTTTSQNNVGGYCSKYSLNSYEGMMASDKQYSFYMVSGVGTHIFLMDTSYTTASALKSALQGTYLWYELSTEYVIPLDGSEVVNDTECLKYLGWTVPKQLAVKNVAKVGGGLHQRVGRVDLGTLNWVNNNGYFYNLNGISYKATSNSIPFNAYTSKYVTKSLDYIAFQVGDKCIGASYDGYLCIRDTSYSDATALRNALSGQYLYYELGTSVEIEEGNEFAPTSYNLTFNFNMFATVARKQLSVVWLNFVVSDTLSAGVNHTIVTLPKELRPPARHLVQATVNGTPNGFAWINTDGTVTMACNTSAQYLGINCTYIV